MVAAGKWPSTMPLGSTTRTGHRKHDSCVGGPTSLTNGNNQAIFPFHSTDELLTRTLFILEPAWTEDTLDPN